MRQLCKFITSTSPNNADQSVYKIESSTITRTLCSDRRSSGTDGRGGHVEILQPAGLSSSQAINGGIASQPVRSLTFLLLVANTFHLVLSDHFRNFCERCLTEVSSVTFLKKIRMIRTLYCSSLSNENQLTRVVAKARCEPYLLCRNIWGKRPLRSEANSINNLFHANNFLRVEEVLLQLENV